MVNSTNRCIEIIKTKDKIIRKCKRHGTKTDNYLCKQHYNKHYLLKDPKTIIAEVMEDILNNLSKNKQDDICSICLENKRNEVSITPICCNKKQNFHLQCLEKFLCNYSDNFNCPICRTSFTTEIISKTFSENQKKLMVNRLNYNINKILYKIKKNYTKFIDKYKTIIKYQTYLDRTFTHISINQYDRCKLLIDIKKNKLTEIYKLICEENISLENQLTKMNKINKDINKTLRIFSRIKYYKYYMKNVLDELNY